MEKSREVAAAEREEPALRATPRRVLPSVKPLASEDHHHAAVHARLAQHYNLASESSAKSANEAQRSMEIASNVDYYKLKHEPLHGKFSRLLASASV